MPEISIIIPMIVTGVAVGSLIRSKSPRISKRMLVSASLIAGLLNGVYGYVVYSFSPQPTFPRGVSFIAQTSWVEFVVGSFLAGFFIVLAVLGIAMMYARIRKGEELEELPELASEQESKLTPS